MKKQQTDSRAAGISLSSALVYLLAAAILLGAILFASSANPNKSLLGFRYYTVLTPSMTPVYKPGDVVVVKLCGPEKIEIGDVITYHLTASEKSYVTHRVVEKQKDDESGLTVFRTKGDANRDIDGFPVEQGRVVGKVIFSIAKLGYVIQFVQLRWYLMIPLVILLLIFFELLDRYRESARAEEEPEEAPEPMPEEPGDELDRAVMAFLNDDILPGDEMPDKRVLTVNGGKRNE